MAVVVVGAVGALGWEIDRKHTEAAVNCHYVWKHCLFGWYAEIWAVEDGVALKSVFIDVELEDSPRRVVGKEEYPAFVEVAMLPVITLIA